MKEEDYAFLNRKPRLFLVGNPVELGYDEEDDGAIGKDSSGIDWYSATNTIASMIFAEGDVAYGLSVAWFNKAMYYVESSRLNTVYAAQGYENFYKVIKEAEDTHTKESIKALFEYTEPIKTYEIPKEGIDERVWFNRAVKAWKEDVKSRKEKTQKVTEAIKMIMEAHTIGRVEM
jgi:hypothetical protein